VTLLGATGSPLAGGAAIINTSSSIVPTTALTPLSPAQPHSHPLDRVGGDFPHDIANSALNLSSNWSGELDSGPGATFTEVAGNWVVPAVQPSATDRASSTWIGIDGAFASSLIQTGTEQNSGPGGTQYYAWYQLVPSAPVVIGLTVLPGDTMHAAVSESAPGTWTITLDDLTRPWSITLGPFPYSTPGLSAEWIEEAPTSGGSVSTLADYGSVTFTNLGIGGTGLSSAFTNPIYMDDQSGAIISYPADLNTTPPASFSVFYGSPRPQVTSVIPNGGGTSGGTTVTIGGNFVTGVSSVDFGGVSVPFTADVANGTVSATSPAHPPGVVDITVTTPGGTSQQTSADQFTYGHGYWLVGSDGGIFSFGSAQFYGSMGATHLQRPVVGIVPTRNRGGYWLDASDGGVFSFGDTQFYGSIPGLGLHPAGSGLPNALNAPVVGMVRSHDQGGYFMVASDGGVFAFGDAHFAGSCPGIGGCAGAAVAVMPDASGNGYWLITQSGNVYTFGDAPYLGGPGLQSSPITSAVPTPSGHGYWILDANGQVFAYGDATSMGNTPPGSTGGLNPASAIFATSDGGGYWVSDALGKVFTFGDAPNDGDMSGTHLNGSIIAASGS
jgi:hypothetical protein